MRKGHLDNYSSGKGLRWLSSSFASKILNISKYSLLPLIKCYLLKTNDKLEETFLSQEKCAAL